MLPDGAVAAKLIEVIRKTLNDLRPREVDRFRITLDSTLDRDLGLDSLARVELFTRVERDFGVHLPDAVFETAERVRDISVALRGTSPASVLPPQAIDIKEAASEVSGVPTPPRMTTLVDVLTWHVEHHPDMPQVTVCGYAGEQGVTFAQLWEQAGAIAGALQHHGVQIGDPVALMLPTSADYFYAFFGVLLAGGIPVPLYPPARLNQLEDHVRRHAGILQNAGTALLITAADARKAARLIRMLAPTLRRVTTTAELCALQAVHSTVVTRADCPALLQYTSGSTGQPKGVVLSHANIIANLSALGAAIKPRDSDVFVSWLPLYHDMGLIGAWLGTLYLGLQLIVMPPLAFLTRPAHWLQAIHRHRGTLSAAPNFAYELCVKRVTDEEIASLDLSTWRLALNGAEAVMPETVARFQKRFSGCGFQAAAMTPVYGMAECSVGLTFPPLGRGPLIDTIERDAFMCSGAAIAASETSTSALQFVSCGRPLIGHQVRVVDDTGHELEERREGRLEFTARSATRGYFRNPIASARLIHDSWLDSGDRAYVADGEIYVTGRIKDVIIRAGRHIYPDELEASIGAIPGIRQGCVAVFGSTDTGRGTERLIVLAETRAERQAAQRILRYQVMQCVVTLIGEPPDDIVLARPQSILKTSSGKIRRAASRAIYEASKRHAVRPRSVWMQVLRLSVGALRPVARRAGRYSIELLYASWFWTLFSLTSVLTFLLVLPPLRPASIWSIAHHAARTFIRGAGINFRVRGQEYLRPAGTHIVVANHSSYLDALFVLAALPYSCRFVAKRELEHRTFVGALLRRLRTEFVERFDVRASAAGTEHLTEIVRAGNSCIFFPEGTFTREPGLMPFHLGAFAAAVAAGVPVLPVAIRGTRPMLRDKHWMPRRCRVIVTIDKPIMPQRLPNAFTAAVQLRDAARSSISQHCGEPDMLATRSTEADHV